MSRSRLSRASLYRAMKDNELPYLKWRKTRRIATADLDAFIESMRHQ